MRSLQSVYVIALSLILCSCLGDKKAMDISEFDDTNFVNSNFNGNLKIIDKETSACENLSASEIASIYNVSADMVEILDSKKSDRVDPNAMPSCNFYIKSGESDFHWPRGSMSIQREIGKDEYMGDVAQASGSGENWEEAWAMKKSMSRSSEWIEGVGLAALWNDRQKVLLIKFEGYTLAVNPIKNVLNKEEVAKDRDYKKAALDMARAAGYIK